MRWKVYYTGGGTFSALDGSPYDAPTTDVQVLVVTDTVVGRRLILNRDYYWWDHRREMWFGGDVAGFYQYLFALGPKKVLFGTMVTNEEHHVIVHAALADPDFPYKSARTVGEETLP